MTAPQPVVSPSVNSISGWKRIAVWPLALILKAWGATLRFDMAQETRDNLEIQNRPVIFVLWHSRLFVVSEIFRRHRNNRRLYALVSASKDGAWLDAFFSHVGIRTVRGSSSNFGREALHALVHVAKAGHDIGITPDGPRGPRHEFKPGAWLVARRSGNTVLLLGADFEKARELRSWDRFRLPRPFSRVKIRCERIDDPDQGGSERIAQLQARLDTISPDHADSGKDPGLVI